MSKATHHKTFSVIKRILEDSTLKTVFGAPSYYSVKIFEAFIAEDNDAYLDIMETREVKRSLRGLLSGEISSLDYRKCLIDVMFDDFYHCLYMLEQEARAEINDEAHEFLNFKTGI